MANLDALMWPGESLIYRLSDVALVKASERKTRANADEEDALKYGTLVITNRRLLLVHGGLDDESSSGETSDVFSVATRQIVLHGISTDVNSFPKPCMYCQLDGDNEGENDGFTGVGGASAYFQSQGGASESGSGDDEDSEVDEEDEEESENGFEELYIVPRSEDKLSEMFDALSKSALENPDEDDESDDDLVNEDEDEAEDGYEDGYEEFTGGEGDGLIYDFDKDNLNEEQLRNLAHLESVFVVPGEESDEVTKDK
jgi:hypothetical protein